jgi:hypothetical protein
MKKQWILTILVLCLSLFGAHLSLAQDLQQSSDDTLTRMLAEGWKIVNDGVLQRELVPGQVESFAFGVPGFTWKVKDLQKQLQKLQAEFRANPTPELRKAIANHRKAIASAKRALELARAAEASGETADLSKASCAINFSYNAAGGPQTSVQGVTTSASATFSGNCGFTGQVYAYAFAKTWVNGAESTQTVTDGPRSGASVSATASASRNGGSPCETYSYGEMVSNSLSPATWSMTATSSSCPVPVNPLAVTVTSNAASTIINLYEYDCVTITWTTNISGGSSPYSSTMYLNSVSQGTRTTYSGTFCNAQTNSSRTLAVSSTVTDSSSPVQTKSASAPTITIQSHYYKEPTTTCYTVTADGATAICP